jgi:hypothetical protein
MPPDLGWAEEVVASWVDASCRAQGIPVKITDPLALHQVCVLLGAAPDSPVGTGAERAHAAAAASTHRTLPHGAP